MGTVIDYITELNWFQTENRLKEEFLWIAALFPGGLVVIESRVICSKSYSLNVWP